MVKNYDVDIENKDKNLHLEYMYPTLVIFNEVMYLEYKKQELIGKW